MADKRDWIRRVSVNSNRRIEMEVVRDIKDPITITLIEEDVEKLSRQLDTALESFDGLADDDDTPD